MNRLQLLHDPAYLAFWEARHLCTVSTARTDGSLHVTPMGIVLDPIAGQAWGVTMGHSVKARNITAYDGGAPVAVCQLEGPYWASLEGTGEILTDEASVREAEQRYASRYRQPRPNPQRVALRITVTRALGRVPEPSS